MTDVAPAEPEVLTDEAILAASQTKPDLVFGRLADMIPYL